MLELDGVHGGYSNSEVLFGISLSLDRGQVATLMGRNGMGKTTTLRTIMGSLHASAGRIVFNGVDITQLPSHKIARLGIGYVPEGRKIFPNLSVRENLEMAARGDQRSQWTIQTVLKLFPRLGERLARPGFQLSGGEQQMLAIGRALMLNPKLLLLDEATEGIAPVIRDEIWRTLSELKSAGISILVVDKEVEELCKLAEKHHLIEKGMVTWTGSSADLLANVELQTKYLAL
ncbi:ABC transporter ATP-binding protein [Bradyrhizobium sp. 186]|uniref:ABC transporter ATP-binding protein n=1 Tax=Bradyrhizobium sp. 186 TaxID=2782654 RepID=UPI0020017E25|nr:ABC transporter ATP-binding protein [Bradyrhizobium sp. 186]UPK38259.1 ABC transporter ATP-binding protein [Bradyrhizobium sp. 186]